MDLYIELTLQWPKKKKYLSYSYGVSRHFQQYFSYIVVVSFIGGGSRRTRKEPPTMGK